MALRQNTIVQNKADGKARISATAQVVEMKCISGPMPSADELAKYEQIIAGSAERFLCIHERQITLVENQAEHRKKLETVVVLGDSKRAWAGLAIGATIVILGGWCGYTLAIQGHDVLAGTVFAADIVGPIGVFVHGTNSRRAERFDRLKALTQYQAESQNE